jgi:hypothetical protein
MAKPAAKKSAGNVANFNTGRVGPTRERAAELTPMSRKPDASTSRGVRVDRKKATESGDRVGPTKARAAAENKRKDEIRSSGPMKTGGKVKKYAAGGSVSARADGIAKRGKTKCKII